MKKINIILIVVLVGLIVLGGYVWFYENSHQGLEFIALDVGQGDAILVKTPFGQNILFDGGPDKRVINALDRNLPFWRRKIDLMVLSHPDSDHVTGLVSVLERYKVKRAMNTGVVHTLPAYIEWLEIIEDEKILMDIAKAPMRVDFGEDLYLDIIYPEDDLVGIDMEDNNMGSVVAKLVYGETCFILTGDAPISVEEELISFDLDLDCEVLKIGHHGSKGSTSFGFLEAVMPEYAVIPVGENKFGHPTRRVTSNLEKLGIEILRTDELGDVVLISDGEEVSIE
ncbi:MBL fold metallo-hydrolase [Candidatus Falkowbacteria bacterium]|nr:MBL fold metallo-hydrolase [Candidatus Falkowbacteria bacterium]